MQRFIAKLPTLAYSIPLEGDLYTHSKHTSLIHISTYTRIINITENCSFTTSPYMFPKQTLNTELTPQCARAHGGWCYPAGSSQYLKKICTFWACLYSQPLQSHRTWTLARIVMLSVSNELTPVILIYRNEIQLTFLWSLHVSLNCKYIKSVYPLL